MQETVEGGSYCPLPGDLCFSGRQEMCWGGPFPGAPVSGRKGASAVGGESEDPPGTLRRRKSNPESNKNVLLSFLHFNLSSQNP
jgi:hypothetical protein